MQWKEKQVIIAWIVGTEGSSFFSAGQMMLMTACGKSWGYLSPGCLEMELQKIAQGIFAEGGCYEMNLNTERTYGCAGELKILFHPVDGTCRAQILELSKILSETSLPLQLSLTIHENLVTIETRRDGTAEGLGFESNDCTPSKVISSSRLGECRAVKSCRFTIPIPPGTHVVLLGASLVNQSLMKLASTLPWRIKWIEDIDSFIDHLEASKVNSVSAVLIATHNFGRDTVAVMHALNQKVSYVGLIGPKKRRTQLIDELMNTGQVDPALLDHLYSPAGLDLGGRQASEVALSIAAEIQSNEYRRSGRALSR